jgi:hypothetical protein
MQTTKSRVEALTEQIEKLKAENDKLREIAAIAQEGELLDKQLQQLRKEIESIKETKKKEIEVDKLRKELQEARNANKPETPYVDAVQYSLESVPKEESQLRETIILHMNRQLENRTLEPYQERRKDAYVKNMMEFIVNWREKKNASWTGGRMTAIEQRAGSEAVTLSRHYLKIKPLVNMQEYFPDMDHG